MKKDSINTEEISNEENNANNERIIEPIYETSEIEDQNKQDDKTTGKLKKVMISILKILMGLYIIGAFVGLNEFVMMLVEPILGSLHNSAFMTAEFIPWVSIVLSPIRFMIGFVVWFTPAIIMNFILFFILSKVKWISDNELKIFSYMMLISLLLIF